MVEGVWWLCFGAAEWVEVRALKVLEGGVDSEPRRECVLKVDVEDWDLGMLMRAETACRAFHTPSILSRRGH